MCDPAGRSVVSIQQSASAAAAAALAYGRQCSLEAHLFLYGKCCAAIPLIHCACISCHVAAVLWPSCVVAVAAGPLVAVLLMFTVLQQAFKW